MKLYQTVCKDNQRSRSYRNSRNNTNSEPLYLSKYYQRRRTILGILYIVQIRTPQVETTCVRPSVRPPVRPSVCDLVSVTKPSCRIVFKFDTGYYKSVYI
jgi:hypothetical protein